MSTSPTVLVILLFHLCLFAPVNCQLKLARRLEQHPIDKRAGFQGGYALQASTCAPGEVVCPEPFVACCPSGTVCDSNSLGGDTACCPNGNLCNSYVTNAPSCANSSWTMWDGGNNPFCCLADQIGVNAEDVSFAVGACVANNVVLASSKAATSLVQVGAQTGAVTSATNTAAGSTAPAGSNTPSASGSTTAARTNNPSATSTGSAPASKHGLSGAVIGGIVAGAVVAIALVALVGFVCYRMGNRRSRSRVDDTAFQGHQPFPAQQAYPMQQDQRYVDQKALPTELVSYPQRVELTPDGVTHSPRAELKG